MSITELRPLSARDRALLRAVDAGHCALCDDG